MTGIRILHVTHGGFKLPKTTHHSSIHFVGDVAIPLAVEYPELGLCDGLSLLSKSVGGICGDPSKNPTKSKIILITIKHMHL